MFVGAPLGSRGACLGRSDQLSPCPRDASRDRRSAGARPRGRRSPRGISPRPSSSAERFGIAHTAIGHHRGAGRLDKARGLAARSIALARWARPRGFDLALGHGSNDVTVAAALLRIPSATTFDYEWARVQHTVNCRLAAAVVVPDVIPPERLYPYGARGQAAPVRGPQGGVLPGRLRARPRRAGGARPGPGAPIALVRTPPAVSLYHRFENDLFGQVLDRLRGAQVVVLPAHARAAGRAGPRRRLHRARARDRRPVADRLRRSRRLGRRDHEPRGGRARHAGVHGLRGAARAPSTSG